MPCRAGGVAAREKHVANFSEIGRSKVFVLTFSSALKTITLVHTFDTKKYMIFETSKGFRKA